MTNASDLSEAKRAILAKMLAGQGKPSRAVDVIQRRNPAATVPLSAGQRQVWLHEAVSGDPLIYTESVTFHRQGACDVSLLAASLRQLPARHEALRARLVFDTAEPTQRFEQQVDLDIPFDDLSGRPVNQREQEALALATHDSRQRFDLQRAPLFRARIVRLAPDDHRIYLTMHHLIFDGVALYDLVLPDLALVYDALSRGLVPPPPRGIGYGDYAVWQREAAQSGANRKVIDYWRKALAAPPAKLDLAGSLNLPARPSRAGAMATFTIPAALTDRIRALGKQHDATAYIVLLTGFSALLHRYTGEEDIIVGGVTDIRRKPELAQVVGYFLNSIALRSRPAADRRFADFLGEVRRMVLDTLDASEVPFDEVVRALDLRRSADVHPLFDILFSVQPSAPKFPDGWDLTQMDVEVGSAKFDLYLELDERPGEYVGRFMYSSDRFDRSTIERFVCHWLMLLDQVTANPDLQLGAIALATADEQAAVAREIEAAAVSSLPVLPEQLAQVVRARPDQPAIIFGTRQVSYRELDAIANGIAARLEAAGAGPGKLVAVMLDRTPEMVAALIAILRTGAAYLPLDPKLPAARLAWIAADAAIDVMLTDQAVAAAIDVPTITLGECPPLAQPAGRAPLSSADLAYVLYTSGSTGSPKGVEIEHGALMNLLSSMQARPGFGPDDRLLAITTISFDIAGLELFLPLVSGGTLILAPSSTIRDLAALAALVAASRPTMMQATPSTWGALLDAGLPAMPGMTMLCGGEALTPDLARRLRGCGARLWNMYGPTETTIWSSLHEVVADDAVVPIGRAIDRTSLHVLGADGWPVADGAAGELFIGGAGLARGYRQRPDLTAERFVERPFAPGLRLYRTGDVVRTNSDGDLRYVGRADDEEKIRGYRVAVQEVEQALQQLPGLSRAAVRSWPNASGERSLVAYLVTKDDRSLNPAELRAQLAQTLPGYMIPSRFERLAALPLTPNQKIDRKALPAPTDATAERPVAGLTGREARLAALWEDVLGVARVAREDSFFDLGGTSLMIAALLRRIEIEFECRMTMASIFEAHRLGEMARAIDENHDVASLIPIQAAGSRPPLLWLDGGPKFRALGTAIGPDQPFLGVPLDEVLKGIDQQPVRFEECARRVARLIRELRPVGPYYLGGWCTSGILAYAVAVELRASGEDVPLAVLADSENPARRRTLHVKWTKTIYHLGRLLYHGGGGGGRLRYLQKRLYGVFNHFTARPTFDHHGQDLMRDALDIAALSYQPPASDGAIALFCSHEWVGARDAVNGWLAVAKGTVVSREFDGNHESLLREPLLSSLATSIRDALVAVGDRSGADRA